MTEEKIALIRKLILGGMTASAACREAGISVQSFFIYRRQENGPFSDLQIKRGRQKAVIPPNGATPTVLRIVK